MVKYMADVLSLLGTGAIMDAGDFYFRSLVDNKVALYLNYANKCSINFKGGSEYAKESGENSIEFSKPSEFTLELNVDLLNLNLLSFIQSSIISEGLKDFTKREVTTLTSDGQVIDIKGTPKADKVEVYTLRGDGTTHIKELTDCTYVSGTHKLTVTSGKVGDIICVYYFEEKNCKSFTVKATPDHKVYYRIDGLIRRKSKEDGADTFINLVANKVSFENTLSMDFDAEKPSSFKISLSGLKDIEGNLAQFREIVTLDGDVPVGTTPISNLIGIAGNTQATLGFSAVSDSTSTKIQYSTDSGATWTDVLIGGSTNVRIASAIIASTTQVTVLGLTNATTYQFRVNVLDGQFAGISNVVSVTPTA
jgi:hypothetical protein